jgi:hypothetical protein
VHYIFLELVARSTTVAYFRLAKLLERNLQNPRNEAPCMCRSPMMLCVNDHVKYTNIEGGTKLTEGGHYSLVNNVLGRGSPGGHVKGGTSHTMTTVRKIGARSTIRHNYPAVGIAPALPYFNPNK